MEGNGLSHLFRDTWNGQENEFSNVEDLNEEYQNTPLFLLNIQRQTLMVADSLKFRPNKPKNGGITAGVARAGPGKESAAENDPDDSDEVKPTRSALTQSSRSSGLFGLPNAAFRAAM